MATRNYNTASGGANVQLTSEQFAKLSPEMQSKYTLADTQPMPSLGIDSVPVPTDGVAQSQPIAPTPTPIAQNGMVDASQMTAPTPVSMPEPQSDLAAETYQMGLQQQIASAETNLTDTLKAERDAALKRQEQLNKQLQNLQDRSDPNNRVTYDQEQRIIKNQLDAAETASASLEEDFNKRRRITSELEGLLTEGNALIAGKKNQPISLAALNKSTNRTIQDVQARAGVLSAVISALDGNVTQAHNIINTAQGTVRTYWQDQQTYNDAYLNLVAAGELASNKIQTDYANAQIALAEKKLNTLQETSDYIQELMINPESAQFMADAGVTLNDDIDTINAKLAEQSKKEERDDTINTLKMEGYEYVPFPGDREDVVTLEIGGQTLAFVPPVEGLNEAVSDALLSGASPEEAALLSGRMISDEDKMALAQGIIARSASEDRFLENQERSLRSSLLSRQIDAADIENQLLNNEVQLAEARKAAIEAGAAVPLSEEQRSTAFSLIDDYEKTMKEAEVTGVINSYGKILASAEDPSPAGDVSLIFAYMKMLDPTSVVREGEQATAANTGSIPQRVWGQYNRAVNGERFNESIRNDFVDRAGKLYDVALAKKENIDNTFRERAGRFGVPADVVLRDIAVSETGEIELQVVSDDQADNILHALLRQNTTSSIPNR